MKPLLKPLVGALALTLGLGLVAPSPAQAASTTVGGHTITGSTYTAWKAAGGTAKFGKPTAARTSVTISGRTGHLQRFTKGQVFTSSLGNQTFTYPSSISLSGVTNERDALARYGFKKGALLRTARLVRRHQTRQAEAGPRTARRADHRSAHDQRPRQVTPTRSCPR